MRDSQRSAVYRWGSALAEKYPRLHRELTLAECEELVFRVWDDYRTGTEPPEVLDGRGRRRACATRWRIKLPRWARRPDVVLHEVSHALGPGGPGHGRAFARLLLELLNRYEGVPIREARAIGMNQKPRRVHFAQAAACPKPRSREWKRWRREVDDMARRLKELRVKEPR